MIRNKVLMIGAAAALLASSLGIAAGTASAGPPPTNVANDHVTCNTIYGTVGFKPSLIIGGTATSDAISVKGVVDGCTDTDNPAVLFTASSFSGKLAGTSNNALSLLGPSAVTGSIKISWKLQKASVKITPTSSVVSPTTATGGTEAGVPGLGANAYASFSLTGTTVTGAFTGSDGGAGSSTFAVTSQDLGAFTVAAATGIKAINLGIGTITVG